MRKRDKIRSGLTEQLSPEIQNVAKMKEALMKAEQTLYTQEDILTRMSSEPLVHACVVSVENQIIPERFEPNDMVLITDEESSHCGDIGRILERKDLEIKVDIVKIAPSSTIFTLGQVKLLFKNDGRSIVLAFENEIFEVWGSDFEAQPGDTAKISINSHQIVEIIPSVGIGELCVIQKVVDENHIKVKSSTQGTRLVICRFEAKKGDEVVLDTSALVAVRYLKKYENKRKQRRSRMPNSEPKVH